MGVAKADSGILGLTGLLHHLLHQLLPPAGCSLLNIRNTPKQVQGRWGCWVPKPPRSACFSEKKGESGEAAVCLSRHWKSAMLAQ